MIDIRRGVPCVVGLVCLLLAASPASAQRNWTSPITLGLGGQQALPRVAVDGAGNALATWVLSNGTDRTTQAVRLTGLTGQWTAASPLTPQPGASTLFEDSDVAVNAFGNGVAAWTRVNPGPGATNEVVQAALYSAASGTWTAPVDLFAPTTSNIAPPKVGIDDGGNAIVTWVQRLNGATVVRVSRYDTLAAQWSSTPVLLSTGPGNAVGTSELSVDGTGNAVVVWTWLNGPPAILQAARYVRNTGVWSAPVSITGPVPGQPKLSLSRLGGSAFVVWRSNDASGRVVAARLDTSSGVWNAAVDLSASNLNAASPDVATDDAGNAVAVWTIDAGGGARRLQSARYDAGLAAWGVATDRTVTGEPSQPAVAMDDLGNAVAIWRLSEANVSDRIQASVFDAVQAAWGSIREVSGPNNPSSAPQVRLDGAGGAVAVWNGTASSGGFVTQASVFAPATAPRMLAPVVNRPNVTLTWLPPNVTQAPTAYTVVAALMPGGPVVATLPVGLQTSVTVPAPDGTYHVRVRATVGGVPLTSNEVVVVVAPGPAPSAPLGLSTVVSGSTFTMTWSPPANAGLAPVQTYIIEAGSAPGTSNLAVFPTGNAVTSFVTPPVPNGSYWVRVRAQGAAGTGPASAEVRAVVGPAPPGAVVLGGTGSAGVRECLWTAAPVSGAPVSGYRLVAGSAPGLSNLASIDLAAAPLSFVAGGVPAGTYYLRVVALSAAGPGEASNELVLVVP